MDYVLLVPAISLDVVFVPSIAVRMALAIATAGNNPCSERLYAYLLIKFHRMLVDDIRAGRLRVCDSLGEFLDAEKHFEAMKSVGTLLVVKRYITEPDWNRLDGETAKITTFAGVRYSTGVDFGPTETDWDLTFLSCFSVKLHFLNEWARARGDSFSISHDGVPWLDAWTNPDGTVDVTLLGRSAKVPTAERPVPHPQAQRTMNHKLQNRSHALSAVIAIAKKRAANPDDSNSVWAALVELAESATRPPPLLGYVAGEGIKYKSDSAEDGIVFYKKTAFRQHFRRHSTPR